MTEQARAARAARWPLRRITTAGVAVVAAFSVAAIVVGVLALTSLATARNRVVDRIDPALQQSLRLEAALVDQETGVRGYGLATQPDFLQPYTTGLATQQDAVGQLSGLVGGIPDVAAGLRQVVTLADAWRSGYAEPTIQQVRTSGQPAVGTDLDRGKTAFDAVRSAVTRLQDRLGVARQEATATLNRTWTVLYAVCIGIALVFVLIVVALAVGLRAAAITPLSRLAKEVRVVADGDFSHPVAQSGPREVRELGDDVNRMRERILQELSALREAHAVLDARTQDLERSNAELEQFAYVASHDLQEPLRKVASFCQLLQRRYAGQIDERADQYIGFAVDGAKRMQVLINDLLAFSRVGRIVREPVPVACEKVVEQAKANLAAAIEQSEATVETGELPTVLAEVPLLTTVFQNLIGNALKFHGEQPPHVTVTADRDGDFWRFSVQDNGIGIDPEYAERIFVIFQRLHAKADYPGTGIGLAMCRKIVEHHGGTIWLDTTVGRGARFCFTLPVLTEEKKEPDDDPGTA
ncbi:signal transduction histidine kinase [Amycolatopsis bartoniae]|uniref:histidine kinase n=1 Tax=Amycolatopsis bartoniae TaxID=941986 RepID=A0A8H9MA26_9PSEU|nr:sensor histidine kinase [Amycolatopsis bartoniae]MBB2938222.1 signal transduction histidine kinase [Amycolatopsis bartoniae]TVT09002.1 HAMP domain-containing protein [Amycolatopsis bartoniae]GHF33574.1 histidine kinase [Amycolatopsis bartoniae]